MEIGSFLELDIRNTGEYYTGECNIARLNTARAGIYHACRLLNCNVIYIPYYLCPSVSRFLISKNIVVKYYNIYGNFEPVSFIQDPNTAVLLVNYFGLLPSSYFENLKVNYKNIIIDNCASFYSKPLDYCYNVYSPRKFFGVPDGCYVIGGKAEDKVDDYLTDISFDTSLFLFKRIEVGCSAAYADRMKNEERIDKSDIMQMSKLTKSLLCGIDYETIKQKRMDNFYFAHDLYKSINLIDPFDFFGTDSVPIVYPLVIENIEMVERLNQQKIYTGRWWKDVLSLVSGHSFEAWLSKYMVPVPIDQRYCKNELKYVFTSIINTFRN